MQTNTKWPLATSRIAVSGIACSLTIKATLTNNKKPIQRDFNHVSSVHLEHFVTLHHNRYPHVIEWKRSDKYIELKEMKNKRKSALDTYRNFWKSGLRWYSFLMLRGEVFYMCKNFSHAFYVYYMYKRVYLYECVYIDLCTFVRLSQSENRLETAVTKLPEWQNMLRFSVRITNWNAFF